MVRIIGKQGLRYAMIGIIILIILASLVLLVQAETDEERLTAFIGLLTGIFSILVDTPLSNLVDQAFFEANNTGAEDVRKRLKEYWIDQYLRAEQRALNGVSHPDDDTAQQSNNNHRKQSSDDKEDEPDPDACELRTHLMGVEKDILDGYSVFKEPNEDEGEEGYRFRFETNKVDPLPDHLFPTITDDDTLSTFYDTFTHYVENDREYTGEFIVLMGERGTRKTVKLLELAEHLVDHQTRVPVYVNLFSWSAGCRELEVWLQEEIVRQYNIVNWKAKRLLDNNYLILLLDGFEEVPHERRRHLVRAIERFLDNRLQRRQLRQPLSGSERPIDLRDSIVIAVKTPKEVEDHYDEPENVADDTDNYVDLKEHVEELIEALQGIGQNGYQAPVAVLRIKPLGVEEVREYLLCQFRQKVLEIEKDHKPANASKKEWEKEKKPLAKRIARATLNEIMRDGSHRLFAGGRPEAVVNIPWKTPEGSQDANMLRILRRSPFLLRAFVSTFYYDRNAGEMRSSFANMTTNERIRLRSAVQNASDLSEQYKVLQEIIIRRYVEQSLRRQPHNIGPHGSVERDTLLEEMATAMQRRRQRVLDDGDVVFYLEDIGLRMLIQNQPKRMLQYKGLVALVTSVIFTLLFLAFAAIVQEMRPEVTLVLAILIVLFGRSFGWQSCGKPDEDRTELKYPLRWFPDAALSAGAFMGLIVGIVFYEMTRIVYADVNQPPLLYEAVVSGIFSFALFLFVGGLELGRRYDVVAQPYEGRRFLLMTTLLAGLLWFVFFFLFMFWPRARFELLTNIQIQELVPTAGLYAAISGTFIGFISGFVLSHLYLRHLVLYWYLGLQRGLRSQYSQVLDHNARPEIGILRKLGGGYVFRHRFIMNFFRKDYQDSLED